MIAAVSSVFTDFTDWIGTVISSLLKFGEDVGALNPFLQFFVIGVAISALFLGVKFIKSFVWGA